MDRPISAVRWSAMRESERNPRPSHIPYILYVRARPERKGELRSWSGRLAANRRTRRGHEEKKKRHILAFFSSILFFFTSVRHCVTRTSKETRRKKIKLMKKNCHLKYLKNPRAIWIQFLQIDGFYLWNYFILSISKKKPGTPNYRKIIPQLKPTVQFCVRKE